MLHSRIPPPTPVFTTVQPVHLERSVELQRSDRQLHPAYDVRLPVQASYTWSHTIDEVSNNGVLALVRTTRNTHPSHQYQINPTVCVATTTATADYDIRSYVQRELRMADAVEVRQQVGERRLRWMDHVTELLRPHGTAVDSHGQRCRHRQLRRGEHGSVRPISRSELRSRLASTA